MGAIPVTRLRRRCLPGPPQQKSLVHFPGRALSHSSGTRSPPQWLEEAAACLPGLLCCSNSSQAARVSPTGLRLPGALQGVLRESPAELPPWLPVGKKRAWLCGCGGWRSTPLPRLVSPFLYSATLVPLPRAELKLPRACPLLQAIVVQHNTSSERRKWGHSLTTHF